MDDFDKLVDRTHGPESCWPWLGTKNGQGYGVLRAGGKQLKAHRVALARTGVEVGGLQVLHACDNPPCCNPKHLRAGTNDDNVRDRVERNRSARGSANGSHTRPESRPRGDRNGSRMHPEKFRGSRNGFARLTEEQVVAIRARHSAGETQTALAREFGVAQTTVSAAVRGVKWRHVGAGGC